MPMRKRGSLGRKTVKSKAVEHTQAAEAPEEKRLIFHEDHVRHSLARASEIPEQYQVRLQSQQVRQNASRAAATLEQRQSCLHEDQVSHRVPRAAETHIQSCGTFSWLKKRRNVAITLKWKVQIHDGFMYNPRYDYESSNLLDIGRMPNVCLKCSALKWKGETPGMCAAPVVNCHQMPLEPLCSLLKGETAQAKDFVKHIRLYNNMFAMTFFKSNVLNNGWTPHSRSNTKCTTMLDLFIQPIGDRRDIVLHSRSCSQMPLQDTHNSCDPLRYPLLFVRGEDG
ncbi:hypothetical protein TNCT_532501 [Trichonephila clavata]|uniref:Uncharacterized protein n=1 Tax=Trichonephila clavata TaxID=2740835 RepID=A0A8X6LFI3_TRICU|nr:hypothetical protein TNCT_532501 [Trichonephila clavata]